LSRRSSHGRPSRVWALLGLSLAVAGYSPAQASADPAYGGTSAGPASGSNAPLSTTPGERARLNGDGTAQAPNSAPDVVRRVIAAGNQIATLPYRYGGGHGRWVDTGYDCSGSVSFALHGGGLVREPGDATAYFRYGQPGPGRWITIYANGGHAFMVVAGLRFDTSGRTQTGSRWQTAMRSSATYIVRHPAGL
jgi:hypothetical protein